MWEYVLANAAALIQSQASVRPMPNGLYVDPAAPQSGDCKGCGAPWQTLPVDTHAMPLMQLIDRYRNCSYCRRPFKL